jgi:HEAT repeat protein
MKLFRNCWVKILGGLFALLLLFGAVEFARMLYTCRQLTRISSTQIESIPLVIARLDDWNVVVRVEAYNALVRLGPSAVEAKPTLLKKLKHPSWQDRSGAASVLKRFPSDPETISLLIELLDDLEGEPRRYAACALGEAKAVAAVPKLIERLNDPHMGLSAAGALGAIGAPAKHAIPMILQQIQQPPIVENRFAYIMALEQFGPLAIEAIPVLQQYVNNPDHQLSQTASNAIRTISTVKPQAN